MTPRDSSRRPGFATSRRSLVKAGSLGAAAFTAGLSPAWTNLVVAQATPATGGEFRTGAAQDAVSMHPFLETDTASFSYIDLHYFLPPLRYAAESMELEPFAAESFTAADDLSSVQFKLKQDLVWSDGEPITADDYVWTWEQASNPDNAWPRLGSYEPFIDTITAADDYTIDVTLKEPIAISLEKANGALTYVLPRHIWEDLAWGDPQANTEILKPTVSGGPFVLEEWRKDQYATFVANENFFLGRPNFDTYTVQLFGNANIALESLYGGDIHQFGPSAEAWPEVLEQDNLQALQWDAPDNAVMYVGFNCRLDIFSTAPVRQALNYALDKELITQELTYGLGERATGMYLPASWAYNPDVEQFAYDPDKARQILEDDGWVEGDDGVREKDGVNG